MIKVTQDVTITITAYKKELETLLEDVETICKSAVEHVGSANYQDREDQALESVEGAFKRLKDILLEGSFIA